MIETIAAVNQAVNSFIWGIPAMVCIIGVGLLLSVRTGFLQIRKFPYAIRTTVGRMFRKRDASDGAMTPFQAVCTALAGTVGTGNIAGVAGAIAIGGPGAVFWMWCSALLGMCTKFAEVTLAVHFRERSDTGEWVGGPMYYIEKGLGRQYRPLAIFFAVAGTICACFGSGTFTQVNAIVEITNAGAQIPVLYTSIALTILVAVITLGGLKSIAVVADKIVPFMAALYVITTMGILFMFRDALPGAIAMVLHDAFTGTAATGGFLGATMMFAMRNGIARGLFSNESGLGSAPIVAAAAKTKWPAEQGLISMTGTFIDTIIICTMTGLTIIVSGVWSGDLNGAAMTQSAFTMVFPVLGNMLLMIGLVLFAFTTILGWNYYGERCVEYLIGVKAILPYRIIFIILVACGPFLKLEAIWILADIVNGLMAIPNLIALLALSGVVVAETKLYQQHLKETKAKENA